MKKLIVKGLAAALLVLSPALAHADTIRMLVWPGYADDDWIAEFEKATGDSVEVVFASTDDEIWSKIRGSGGADFDLVSVNTAELRRYIDAGLAVPLDLAKIPNQQKALPQFRDLGSIAAVTKDGKVYGVPLAYDSIGLIYDKDKVKEAPDSWSVLWDPAYKGKVLDYNASSHNFSVAAMTMGYKPFNLSDDEMGKVRDKLKDLRKNVLTFYSQPDEAMSIYQNNDIALIFANYGHQQLRQMQKAGANVGYVVPKEGALAWLDTFMITSGAKSPDAAYKWVNFILDPKRSAQLSERQGFGNTMTPMSGQADSDKGELQWLLPVENFTKRTDMWNEVMAGQ
ncbi:extracellular solute-binding protein [Mesorhizobium sp. M3A.F.Ca.ET.201.01.1.1]|uniref:ABC transporter substrate-binding protein n=1 Tax=Mesorhizobium sp. M3A.F.Ca.ET.201.01.1.1 TaxID=2563946 RepID=UPI001093B71C|nr:ABC transporter substrate-binding protein [Mesorhizobium sp. M3A.F.Ca.ET.201.01.1.1]TGS71747.1 extracellular solute-binding protein [Mesorhizobium sp. M3A.F.Ca.ET.201.01.1.1]